MTYIARMNIDRPVAFEALQAVPNMVLQIEDAHRLEEEPERFIFWASGDDFETFETALDADPTIASYSCLAKRPDRRLYRIFLSEEGRATTLYQITAREDIVAWNVTLTAEGVEFQARFPSREAFFTLRDAARERNRNFELLSLYEEKPTENGGGSSNRYGVTDAQQEALLAALEQGYFSVPRQTTMKAVAESLDISTSALSSRLRRGQQALLRNTLAQEPSI
ncbi:helix-turn-helix domain-containing protein [Haloarcula amylovorans]|uniref:helix-turn-helix domain-containing protein n=1 Tax=Haloarcula amylovorans TaxID=2562280 RepID=UPI0010761FA0|nr:helix-turn-helix domain-containing protein [Halomicroarcula amylolytica]